MSYVISSEAPPLSSIHSHHLVVRIGENNFASIKMFEKLGFIITKHVEIFGEIEMRLQSDIAADKVDSWSKGTMVKC